MGHSDHVFVAPILHGNKTNFIRYFIGYGCGFISGSASFRTAWGTQFIPCVILIIGLPFLPRSPRWLAKVGKEEEAIQTLADIQTGGDRHDALVIAEWREISETLAIEREAGRGWTKFVKKGMWKRTMAGLSVQVNTPILTSIVGLPNPLCSGLATIERGECDGL